MKLYAIVVFISTQILEPFMYTETHIQKTHLSWLLFLNIRKFHIRAFIFLTAHSFLMERGSGHPCCHWVV